MNERNFLNFHVLISHSPSCLNRDDMNMQKSAVFGGVRRVRVSSQSLKHWMRKSEYFRDNLPGVSTRTRAMADEIVRELRDKTSLEAKKLEELVVEAITLLVSTPSKEYLKKGHIYTQVIPWTETEKRQVVDVLETLAAENDNKRDMRKALEEELKGNRRNLAGLFSKGADIALFGRMTTTEFMPSIDGAVSVAHSITTHAVDADIDWFTAVDDLVGEDNPENERGAAHLNTQEFGAGVFYRFASINLPQLRKNMGEVARADALEVAAHLLHMLALVVPDAKQRSFAAYNPADFVLASFSSLPLSAANAFETPVRAEREGGFLKPSIRAFENYWNGVRAGYSLDDLSAVFSLGNTALPNRHATLAEIEAWVRRDGE